MSTCNRGADLLFLKNDVGALIGLPDPLFLDTETTALEGEIVDVAVVDVAGAIVFSSLVHPTTPIEPGATRVHGITNEMVMAAGVPTWDVVYAQLRPLVQGHHVLAYNAKYDRERVAHTGKLYRLAGLGVYWHDVMVPFAILYGEWSGYYSSYRYQKLSEAIRFAGLPQPINYHRAAADAEACRRLWAWLPEGVRDAIEEIKGVTQ